MCSNPFSGILRNLAEHESSYPNELVGDLLVPLQSVSNHDELINLAKTFGQCIYDDMEPSSRIATITERINQVNQLLNLQRELQNEIESSSATTPKLECAFNNENALVELRIEFLNAIMLFLCTGLQSAQNVLPSSNN